MKKLNPERLTKAYYVYILVDPLGDVPIYVGKGSGDRPLAHGWEARGGCECRKCIAIRAVWEAGRDVRVDYVFESDSEPRALAREKDVVLKIGLRNLTNVVAGHAPWYKMPPCRKRQIEEERKAEALREQSKAESRELHREHEEAWARYCSDRFREAADKKHEAHKRKMREERKAARAKVKNDP